MNALGRGAGLHLVTDRKLAGWALMQRVEAALRGGVAVVQLREKDLEGRDLQRLALDLRDLCHRFGVPLLINDRLDVALAVGADGVHLPADSFSVASARSLMGPHAIVGVSTHSPEEVSAAAAQGADYVFFGPVFATPAKVIFGAPQGLDRLRAAVAAATLPVIAIGGMTPVRAGDVRGTGAAGLAAISALVAASDPESAAAAMHW